MYKNVINLTKSFLYFVSGKRLTLSLQYFYTHGNGQIIDPASK